MKVCLVVVVVVGRAAVAVYHSLHHHTPEFVRIEKLTVCSALGPVLQKLSDFVRQCGQGETINFTPQDHRVQYKLQVWPCVKELTDALQVGGGEGWAPLASSASVILQAQDAVPIKQEMHCDLRLDMFTHCGAWELNAMLLPTSSEMGFELGNSTEHGIWDNCGYHSVKSWQYAWFDARACWHAGAAVVTPRIYLVWAKPSR